MPEPGIGYTFLSLLFVDENYATLVLNKTNFESFPQTEELSNVLGTSCTLWVLSKRNL